MTNSVEKIEGKRFAETEVSGKWILTRNLTNTLGVEGFSSALISNYPDPFVPGVTRGLMSSNGAMLLGYTMTTPKVVLSPDTKFDDRYAVNFLLGHPEVQVDGIDLVPEARSRKSSNPIYKLVAVDKQHFQKIDDDDIIDRVIAKIIVQGPQALSLEKIRGIMATLNLNYINRRYHNDKSSEKKILVSNLKIFVRQSVENAKRVEDVIKDIAQVEHILLIKEMMRFDMLIYTYGSYKYKNEAIAIDIDGVIKYFVNNPDLYAFIKNEVAVKQEQEDL